MNAPQRFAVFIFLFCLAVNSFAQQNQPSLVLQNGHTASITAVAISSNGKILASAGQDANLIFWDVPTGRLLRALTIGSRRDIIGVRLADTARTLAFSPDGKILAALQQGAIVPSGKILFYEVETARLIREIPFASYDEFYSDIAFSPDGKTFAVARTRVDDAKKLTPEIQIWDMATSKALFTLEGHAKAINSIAFSPDGRILASGSDDTTIKLWDARIGKEIRALKSHTGGVTVIAFSRDGNFFASLSMKLKKGGAFETHGESEGIKVWDAQTWREIRTLKNESNREVALAFSPDGKTLVSVGGEEAVGNIGIVGETTLWNFRTGEKIEPPEFSDEGGEKHKLTDWVLQTLVFSADGAVAVSPGGDNSINLLAMKTNRVRLLRGSRSHAFAPIALDASGRTLAAVHDLSSEVLVGNPNEVFFWTLGAENDLRQFVAREKKPDKDYSDDRNIFPAAIVSPDGKLLAGIAAEDETSEDAPLKVILWDVESGATFRTFGTPLSSYSAAIAFSTNMKRLACVSMKNSRAEDRFLSKVQVWNIATRRELQTINDLSDLAPIGLARSIAFSPNLDKLVVSDSKITANKTEKKPARIYDLNIGKEIRRIENFNDPFAFSPDGKILIGVSDARDEIHLYDAMSYTKLQTVKLTAKQKSSNLAVFVFSRDGKMFASVEKSDTAQVWETQSGREVSQLKMIDKNIASLTFTPNGKFIFTGNDDATLSLWNATSGERLADLISLETIRKKKSDEAGTSKSGGREWLVVTPEGLFDGMPASWNQLLWRFSPKISDVAPVESYFKEFYYPGLLNDLLSPSGRVKALAFRRRLQQVLRRSVKFVA